MNKNLFVAIALIGLMIAGLATYLMQANSPPVEVAPNLSNAAAEPDMPPAPANIDFALPDLDGNERQLAEWNGKARLVNFWATWCAPCRREIPLLKKTQAEHEENGVQIIGIAVDFAEEVSAYAEEAQFNYPILVGQEEAMAAAEASGIEFIGLPFTIVLAPDGELLATHIGEIVESHIDTILGVFSELDSGAIDKAQARIALRTL